MKNIAYQQKAVKELVGKTIDLLSLSGNRHILVFKSPTGSGKTVMASEMLMRLNNELIERPDSPYTEVAYIWIAPNKLHEQSYFKMKNYFTETKVLRPVIYDELDHSIDGYIKSGEILFVNWESINKDNAIMIRDTELSASLYDITRRTQVDNGIPIVVIIDEEHMFGSRNAKKSEKVLANIQPKVEIRLSATPLPETTARADEQVNVPREKVIAEEMIKEGVVLNPELVFKESLGSLNQHLIYLALKKRKELAEAYNKLGVNINPLLLIQLPNDGEGMSSEDNSVKEEVLEYLDKIENITVNNGKLAIWLSNEKTDNLRDIADNDDLTEVLLFKQAIALGWDCPRAAVLLIFRKIESFTFSAQTVGRILRMPEQHYYQNDILNRGYVYTNLSKDIIEIVKEDMDYMSSLHAVRRAELVNVNLISEYNERTSAERNRLGSDFKRHLISTFEKNWLVTNLMHSLFTAAEFDGEEEQDLSQEDRASQIYKNRQAVVDKINFNVASISIDIVEDLEITGEIGQTMIKNKAKYVRTMSELNIAFMAFCAQVLGGTYERVSVKTLAIALQEAMEELFELFESDAIKVILFRANRKKFIDIIQKALNSYSHILRKRQVEYKSKGFVRYNWEVPADRLYKEDTNIINEQVENHALMPYIQLQNIFAPELKFAQFLEENKEYIDWWYKNGDSGKQHYSIGYTNVDEEKALFYVDFVIRMKNGQIFLFDTKSAGSDKNGANKHNALIDYINNDENKDKSLKGGIIIQDGENWKYSPMKIENTTEIVNWDSFYPDEYKL
jgi:type III restriction enzyme